MVTLHVQFLSPSQSLQLLSKLVQEEIPVKIGLKGQYFVAATIFRDLNAEISHGHQEKPDIKLSDKIYSKLLEQFKHLSSPTSGQAIEVKTFSWNSTNFKSAVKSYIKGGKLDQFFIGLSPALCFQKNIKPNFKNYGTARITSLVITMESVSKDEDLNKLWVEINKKVALQLEPDEELHELPVDRILEVLNFKNIQQQEQTIERQGKSIERLEKSIERQGQAIERLEEASERQEQVIQELKKSQERGTQELIDIKTLLQQLLKQ